MTQSAFFNCKHENSISSVEVIFLQYLIKLFGWNFAVQEFAKSLIKEVIHVIHLCNFYVDKSLDILF